MKTTITRRTALAASVTLPLLPASAFAAPGNATDAAWSAYEAANILGFGLGLIAEKLIVGKDQ